MASAVVRVHEGGLGGVWGLCSSGVLIYMVWFSDKGPAWDIGRLYFAWRVSQINIWATITIVCLLLWAGKRVYVALDQLYCQVLFAVTFSD